MTNFTKEIKKFNFKSGSIWDFRYAFNSLIWDIEAERNRSEDNEDFDKAVEMYAKEIEVKKSSKSLTKFMKISPTKKRSKKLKAMRMNNHPHRYAKFHTTKEKKL